MDAYLLSWLVDGMLYAMPSMWSPMKMKDKLFAVGSYKQRIIVKKIDQIGEASWAKIIK